jgi:nucleotide-binding universal stress UspA family protein
MLESVAIGLEANSITDDLLDVALHLGAVDGASLRAVYVEDLDLVAKTALPATTWAPMEGPIPVAADALRDLEQQFRDDERTLGHRFLDFLSDHRLRGSFSAKRGRVEDILVEESKHVDLLVLGKFGSTTELDGSAVHLGRHLEDIVRQSYCPVLVVPPGGFLGTRILVAYDGSSSAHRALVSAVAMAHRSGAEIQVLIVTNDDGSKVTETARLYLEAHDIESGLTVRSGEPAERILESAQSWDASVIAMGAFGHGWLAEKLGRAATHDVLGRLDRTALLCGPEATS